MKTAILAILLFCVMIFPHELGHFIAAKRCGVRVNEFAFGMGPVIWKKQKGETLHTIRLFPIGGFCAMEGEDEDSEDERAFGKKKPWQKIIILAAGSLMNVLCAIIIMCIVVGARGFATTTIGQIAAGSAAESAGLAINDKIISITTEQKAYEIDEWADVSEAMDSITSDETISIGYERGGSSYTAEAKPTLASGVDSQGNTVNYYVLGISCKISHSPFKALVAGTQSTWAMTKMMFAALGQLFTGEASPDELTGPVGMVQMVSKTTEYGFWYYGFLTALICLNLAVINMLPLPALDGGRIIFVLYSAITGKQVSEKVEGTIHLAGLALLMLLMIYVTFNDVERIIG